MDNRLTQLTTEILVVGGGTGGTSAAIQAARRGRQTLLVSEFPWLGGMLTSAGVAAPDGNELAAWQTGLWGAFLQALYTRQPEGLSHGWVSLFTYNPRIGAKIFSDWVEALPSLQWISGQTPLEVLKQGNRITGVRFQDYLIKAKIVIDGTELGDLLALADVPYRWGWELQSQWHEPSAPKEFNKLTQRYPVQSPTWVFILQDYGERELAPKIPAPSNYNSYRFIDTYKGYGIETFLNYARLPGNKFMINWPHAGNDYGEGVERLIASESEKQEFLEEAFLHSYSYAHFLQQQLGQRYGLAESVFPHSLGKGAFGLHPYYRESRRLQGQKTLIEPDILPLSGGNVAALPMTAQGEVSAITIGNYPNDHHYPGFDFPLQPKSIQWGGRWTGTPFTIPYPCLVPKEIEGFLVCEKNISVSHIANGATRLQPVVMNIGQAAGMAAALCIEQNCQPQKLPIRQLQEALLNDSTAPAAIIPLFNLPPNHPEWLYWQRYYLDNPHTYSKTGYCPQKKIFSKIFSNEAIGKKYTGVFQQDKGQYHLLLSQSQETLSLITIDADIDSQLRTCVNGDLIAVWGEFNPSGGWLQVMKLEKKSSF